MSGNEVWLAAKVLELDERVADLYRRLDVLSRLIDVENDQLEAWLAEMEVTA